MSSTGIRSCQPILTSAGQRNRLTAQATRLEVLRGSPESSTVGNFAVQLATLEGSRDAVTGAYAEPVARWAGLFTEALEASPEPAALVE